MNWNVDMLPEAEADLENLDGAVRPQILRGIAKVSGNPEYPNGYGKPLRNQAGNHLRGLYKIKFKKAGIRVVYALQYEGKKMTIIVISIREDEEVYKEAAKRREKHDL
jgi:mRNA interferase RelE/StbE